MYNQEIVRLVIDGDIDAFSKMYNDCAPAVYRRAYSLLDDATLSREAVRNVFRDIKRHINVLKNPENFDEWVFRLANAHIQRLKSTADSWFEPDLKSVWEELNDEIDIVNTSYEKKQENEMREEAAAISDAFAKVETVVIEEPVNEQSIEDAPSNPPKIELEPEVQKENPEIVNELDDDMHISEWQPIIFPPEEGGGRGAASLKSIEELNDEKLNVSSDGSIFELEPLKEDERKKKEKSKKLRRVRFEAATVVQSDNYRVEQVPYDYIPYEESSQEAYDKVSLDETPRAVYEHIPYHRPVDFSEAGEMSVEQIPYASRDNKRNIEASFLKKNAAEPMKERHSSEIREEFGVLTPLVPFSEDDAEDAMNTAENQINISETKEEKTYDAPELNEQISDDVYEKEMMPENWMNFDPLDINVDDMLQEIVEEVNAEDAANQLLENEQELTLATQDIEETIEIKKDAFVDDDVVNEKDNLIAVKPEIEDKTIISDTETISQITDEEKQETPVAVSKVTNGQTVIVPEKKEEGEEPVSAMDPSPRKKKSKLAGAGFFIGVVVLIGVLIYLGYYMKFW